MSKSHKHTCHARGCKRSCKPEYLMCGWHWRQVPRKIQSLVYRFYQEGQCNFSPVPSEEWHAAADLAIAWVAWKEKLITDAAFTKASDRMKALLEGPAPKSNEEPQAEDDPLAPTSVALETAQWLVSDESFYISSENISPASFARYLRAAKKAADKGKKSICLLWLGRWREDFARARSRALVLARDKAVVAERWVLAEELVKGAHEELAHMIRSETVKNEEKRRI